MQVLLPSLSTEQLSHVVVVTGVYAVDVFEQEEEVDASAVGSSDLVSFN